MGFLTMAREFEEAASLLADAVIRMPKEGADVHLSNPLYFLYAHTVELALKAFLSHNEPVPMRGPDGHDLVALHDRCVALGLSLPVGAPTSQGSLLVTDLKRVVTSLASENDSQGFRYFNPNCAAIPELPWTRDVVDALVRVVGERCEAQGHRFPPEGVAKMQFVTGKLPRWDAVPPKRGTS